MNIRVILSPDAKEDISSVIEWYYRADPNLASRFEQETLTTLHRIGQFPYGFRIMNGTVRQALLKRFPYAVYYSLGSKNAWGYRRPASAPVRLSVDNPRERS